MIWMDVDTALSEVPVNLMPLLDDTDFKSIEEAVAYNATGMELIWHFTTTGGATSATVVTPTTGGAYDWAHQDGGMYTIEIPASGGASINNDTEGFGYFTGKAKGVLPWRGPTIGFRAATLNNAMVDTAPNANGGIVTCDADGNVKSTIQGILSTALTETSAGYLAAAFKKLFDVKTPLLVASEPMRGTDGANTTVPDAAGTAATLIGNLETHGDGAWATATGFSTHSAADVVTALGTGSTLTDCLTASGFSTHSAADVVTALGTGSTLTDCLTASGFSTHSAADVVTALGTGSTLTDCLTASGFSTHSAADVVTALGTGSTLTDCLTASGFSTHSAADVKTAIEADGSTIALSKAILDKVDTTLVLDGAVYDFTAAALAAAPSAGASAADIADAVWDETAADHDTAGSMGERLNDAGAASDPLANPVPGSYAAGTAGEYLGYLPTINERAALISAASIEVTSAVEDDGTINIVQGDAYTTAMGRQLTWTADYTGTSAISDATLTFWAITRDGYKDVDGSGIQIGTVTGVEGTSDVALTVELTSAQTALLAGSTSKRQPTHRYEVRAEWSDGTENRLARGDMRVYPRIGT